MTCARNYYAFISICHKIRMKMRKREKNISPNVRCFPTHVCLWFLTAVPRDFRVLHEHDPQRLSSSLGGHILFCAMNVGLLRFYGKFQRLIVLQSFLGEWGNIERKNQRLEPTWIDLGNLTLLRRCNLGQGSFQRHNFSSFLDCGKILGF